MAMTEVSAIVEILRNGPQQGEEEKYVESFARLLQITVENYFTFAEIGLESKDIGSFHWNVSSIIFDLWEHLKKERNPLSALPRLRLLEKIFEILDSTPDEWGIYSKAWDEVRKRVINVVEAQNILRCLLNGASLYYFDLLIKFMRQSGLKWSDLGVDEQFIIKTARNAAASC